MPAHPACADPMLEGTRSAPSCGVGWDEGGLARPRALLSTLGGEGALAPLCWEWAHHLIRLLKALSFI